MPNKLIDIVGVSKSYGDNLVLDDLNLYIRENEFLTLLGPSGCGCSDCSLGWKSQRNRKDNASAYPRRIRKSGLRKSNFRWKGHYIPCTE